MARRMERLIVSRQASQDQEIAAGVAWLKRSDAGEIDRLERRLVEARRDGWTDDELDAVLSLALVGLTEIRLAFAREVNR